MAAIAPNTIKPAISMSGQGVIMFPYAETVALQRTYTSQLSAYQAEFGIYSHMELTSTKEYLVNTFSVDSLGLQAASCDITDTDGISREERTIAPCHVVNYKTLCAEETLGTALMTAREVSGSTTSDAGLQNLIMDIAKNVSNAGTASLLALNIAGGLYEVPAVGNDYAYKAGVTSAQQANFVKQVSVTCEGWIVKALEDNKNSSISDANGKFGTANNTVIDGSTGANTYAAGKARLLKNALLAASSAELQDLFTLGAQTTSTGQEIRPVIIVDAITFNAIVKDYDTANTGAALNNDGTYKWQTINGRNYMFMDNILVYPETSPRAYEKYLTGYQAFMALTFCGNMNLGNSFAQLPLLATSGYPAAFMASQKPGLNNLGTWEMRSDYMVASDISDTGMVTIASAYIFPAA
jgi:peptidoglycan hydrolase-like protein with peptidoglycan-binding domain